MRRAAPNRPSRCSPTSTSNRSRSSALAGALDWTVTRAPIEAAPLQRRRGGPHSHKETDRRCPPPARVTVPHVLASCYAFTTSCRALFRSASVIAPRTCSTAPVIACHTGRRLQPAAYKQSGSAVSTHHHGEVVPSSTSKASRKLIASGGLARTCPPAGPRLLLTRPARRSDVINWLR